MNKFHQFLPLALSGVFLFSCGKEDKPEPKPNTPGGKEPIVLECDYFNQDRVLSHDPDRAVDYIVNCVMVVSADVKIEPGVVIEFEQDAGIEIDDFNVPKASLSAVGTSDKPIVFRGTKKKRAIGAVFSIQVTALRISWHMQK